jgi:hypothetical protein
MRVGALLVVVAALATASAAQAASVAYVDNGAVWVSKLDGSRKVMLADANSEPVAAGPFREISAADSGRILANRRPDNRGGQYAWFQIFEPDGSSTIQGSLRKTGSWATYTYPTALDISGDGAMLAYGFANSSCCPYSFGWGTYVTSVSAAAVGSDPIVLSGPRDPSLVGRRIVSTANDNITYTQNDSSASPFNDDFTQWSDAFTGARAAGYEMGRTDVAANGTLAAGEFIKWDPGSSTRLDGGIFVYSIASLGGALTGAIGCDLPQQGIASDVSLSQDAKLIAWRDDGGVKVAGAPIGQVAQPDGGQICTLGSDPVVISPTGKMPSIGGADVDVLRPPPVAPADNGSPAPTQTGPNPGPAAPGSPGAAPALGALPRLTTKLLKKGVTITVRVGAAGRLTVTATVPAKRLGQRGKPVVIATGGATASAAGNVKVKLRLNALGRKKLRKLKGARMSLAVRQNGKVVVKSVVVRR